MLDFHERKIAFGTDPEGSGTRGTLLRHHSDRGCQYCSHEYVNRLQERGLPISMTESNHCAENALAERMNGILKQEYGLGVEFPTKALARAAARQGFRAGGGKRDEVVERYGAQSG